MKLSAAPLDCPPPDRRRYESASRPGREDDAPKLKVIVVESHALQRKYMATLIKNLGFEVELAKNGKQGLDLIGTSEAQILITGLNMPGMTGVELTREVRSLNLDRYIHVIMITGREEDDRKQLALDAGVDDFISKGPNRAMLLARIRTAVRLIQREQELAERNRVLKEAKEHIEKDLRAAAVAQRNLLPRLHDNMLGFRVESAFLPSSFVSGDMFGCFPISDTQLGFYTVDVSGHGVQASLLSVAIGHLITPTFFRNSVTHASGKLDPAALLTELNERFLDNSGDQYFTMFCGIADLQSGQLHFCQAGHPSPLYLDQTGKAVQIGTGGFPVGILSQATYENQSVPFDPGAMLVLCSDGAIEAENLQNEHLGEQRLREIIEREHQNGVRALPQGVVRALKKWRGGQPLDDDLTVIALERMGTNDPHFAV